MSTSLLQSLRQYTVLEEAVSVTVCRDSLDHSVKHANFRTKRTRFRHKMSTNYSASLLPHRKMGAYTTDFSIGIYTTDTCDDRESSHTPTWSGISGAERFDLRAL
jgi:hypothetical protein